MRRLVIATVLAGAPLTMSAPAAGHTDSDLVAVPAGGESTVTLRPTHGCGDSPTVAVRVRAPIAATPVAVDGWAAAATPQDGGATVLEWSGGELPADAEGAFPVTFTAPDEVGRLLLFPAIQICANGEELAWIDGDPAGEYPAPRLLVLPAGSEPAATIDDVALDAPGREQLVAIVDVDNPQAPPTTTPPTLAATTTTATAPATTSSGSTTTAASAPPTAPATTAGTTTTTAVLGPDDESGGGGGGTALLVVGGLGVVAAGGTAAVLLRRRALPQP